MTITRKFLKIATFGVSGVSLMYGTLLATDGGFASAATAVPSTTPLSLCQSIGQLNKLVVRRTDAFNQNHFRFSFAAVVTVGKAQSVQSSAKALCALPKMPSGALNCPADYGIVYQLTFSSNRRAFPVISADATGCGTVKGILPTRWTLSTSGFWQTLGHAMGLASSASSTFRGSAP